MHRALLIELLFVVCLDGVLGQASSNVTCSAQTSWMQNSLGQNPCLVSAYLSGACDGGDWFVPTLSPGSIGPYNPPQNDALNSPNTTGASICRCNTVVYNLLQACSVCQGGIIGSWADWIGFCPSENVNKTFPVGLPNGTSIPGWATLDPTIVGMWNATQAEQYAVSRSTPPPANPPAHKKDNAGLIAGVVIGSLFVAIDIALVIMFFLRKDREDKGEKVTPYTDGGRVDIDDEGYLLLHKDAAPPPLFTPITVVPSQGKVLNWITRARGPYSQSDRSTFVSSPIAYDNHGPSTSKGSNYGHGYHEQPETYPLHPIRGAYTGAAEV